MSKLLYYYGTKKYKNNVEVRTRLFSKEKLDKLDQNKINELAKELGVSTGDNLRSISIREKVGRVAERRVTFTAIPVNNKLHIGKSVCGSSDNFEKRKGRKHSMENAKNFEKRLGVIDAGKNPVKSFVKFCDEYLNDGKVERP